MPGSYFRPARTLTVAAVAALGALGAAAPRAQVARSGGEASGQLVGELQQLTSERTELQAQNAKLQKDLDAMRKERDALKNAQQAFSRRAQLSETQVKQLQGDEAARRQSTDKELAQWKERMQELVAKFRETVQTLNNVESDRDATKRALAASEQSTKVCVDRNTALYKLNGEVLTRLAHQSVWSSLARDEPFTRIKRNQLENIVEGYSERADAQRVRDASAASPASANAPATPSTGAHTN